MSEQCVHVKDDGTRCGTRHALYEDGMCFWHSRYTAEKREAARSKGGRVAAVRTRKRYQRVASASEVPDPPESAADAKAWASWLTFATATGAIDKGTAKELASVLRCFLASLEKAEVEAEIAELRGQIAELRGKPKLKIK